MTKQLTQDELRILAHAVADLLKVHFSDFVKTELHRVVDNRVHSITDAVLYRHVQETIGDRLEVSVIVKEKP